MSVFDDWKGESKTAFSVLKANNHFNSKVDIIIPFHGQYEKLTRLIESLVRLTANVPYNLFLVDDASKNPEYSKDLFKQDYINGIRSNEHLGFVGALYQGYINTDSSWVVFLNSDVEIVDPNWLRHMGESYYRHKKEGVKMVSAKNNNPCGSKKMYGATRDDASEDIFLEEKEHLSFECVFFHRDLFRHMGGFLKNYYPGWYEDDEFAYRMRYCGFKQLICGNAFVFHHGQATIRDLWEENVKLKKMMFDNKERCVEDIKKNNKFKIIYRLGSNFRGRRVLWHTLLLFQGINVKVKRQQEPLIINSNV